MTEPPAASVSEQTGGSEVNPQVFRLVKISPLGAHFMRYAEVTTPGDVRSF